MKYLNNRNIDKLIAIDKHSCRYLKIYSSLVEKPLATLFYQNKEETTIPGLDFSEQIPFYYLSGLNSPLASEALHNRA